MLLLRNGKIVLARPNGKEKAPLCKMTNQKKKKTSKGALKSPNQSTLHCNSNYATRKDNFWLSSVSDDKLSEQLSDDAQISRDNGSLLEGYAIPHYIYYRKQTLRSICANIFHTLVGII